MKCLQFIIPCEKKKKKTTDTLWCWGFSCFILQKIAPKLSTIPMLGYWQLVCRSRGDSKEYWLNAKILPKWNRKKQGFFKTWGNKIKINKRNGWMVLKQKALKCLVKIQAKLPWPAFKNEKKQQVTAMDGCPCLWKSITEAEKQGDIVSNGE